MWCLFPHSYYRGIRQMVLVSDQDMNTHLAEVSRVGETHQNRPLIVFISTL